MFSWTAFGEKEKNVPEAQVFAAIYLYFDSFYYFLPNTTALLILTESKLSANSQHQEGEKKSTSNHKTNLKMIHLASGHKT